MIKESMTIQGLHVISLALTPIEGWEVARRPLNTASAAEVRLMVTLTVFAVVVLIISFILLFWARAKYRQIATLTATNEKLRQEIAELKRGQVEALENISDAEPPRKEIPALNLQARN